MEVFLVPWNLKYNDNICASCSGVVYLEVLVDVEGENYYKITCPRCSKMCSRCKVKEVTMREECTECCILQSFNIACLENVDLRNYLINYQRPKLNILARYVGVPKIYTLKKLDLINEILKRC